MAAVDSDVTPTSRSKFELLETFAVTNAAATATKNRALAVPDWANAVTFLLDITITGTTPLFDLSFFGASLAGGRRGATLDSTTDKYPLGGAGAAITQLTTDASSPTVAIEIGPGLTLDTTGSATANCAYAFPAFLPPWLIYTYTYDGTTQDEDYNGTLCAYWHHV